MKIESLINYVQSLIGQYKTSDLIYVVYHHKKNNDGTALDPSKVNGIATLTTGEYVDVQGLVEGNFSLKFKFIVPQEQANTVYSDLETLVKSTIGLVVNNSTIESSDTGATAISMLYPVMYNYINGTMGECFVIDLQVYFDVTNLEMSNNVKLYINNGTDENGDLTWEEVICYSYSEAITIEDSAINKSSNGAELINSPSHFGKSFTIKGPVIIGSFIKTDILDVCKTGEILNYRWEFKTIDQASVETLWEDMKVSGTIALDYTRGNIATYSIRFTRGD